jgi:hypothetical protein
VVAEMGKFVDLTGRVFGKLKVIERSANYINNGRSYVMWKCECECKNVVVVRGCNLISGNTSSCGCGEKDNLSKISKMNRRHNPITHKNLKNHRETQHYIDGTKLESLTQKLSSRNTSGIKGVSYDKSRNKWEAKIGFKGKTIHLGRYETIDLAKLARQKAEEELFQPIIEEYQSQQGGDA